MRIRPQWHSKCPCQSKINQLQIPLSINTQILWLQIAMQNTMTVTIPNPLDQLRHELLDHRLAQSQSSKHTPIRQRLAPSTLSNRQRLHVFLEIEIEEFEDEVQFVAVGVDDVEQAYDVGVIHFLEQGDFADGGGGDAFVFGFETDFLEGDNAAGVREVFGFVDYAVCAWRGSLVQVFWRCMGWRASSPSPIFSILW